MCFMLSSAWPIYLLGITLVVTLTRASPVIPKSNRNPGEYIETFNSLKKPLKQLISITRSTLSLLVSFKSHYWYERGIYNV